MPDLGAWDFYYPNPVSSIGSRRLAIGSTSSFKDGALKVDGVAGNAAVSELSDSAGEITVTAVVKLRASKDYDPANGLTAPLIGSFSSFGFAIGDQGLIFRALGISPVTPVKRDIVAGYAFLAFALSPATKTLRVYAVQPASGIDFSREITSTTSFTPRGGKIGMGNDTYKDYQSPLLTDFLEFSIYRSAIHIEDMHTLYLAAKDRCRDKGIAI